MKRSVQEQYELQSVENKIKEINVFYNLFNVPLHEWQQKNKDKPQKPQLNESCSILSVSVASFHWLILAVSHVNVYSTQRHCACIDTPLLGKMYNTTQGLKKTKIKIM